MPHPGTEAPPAPLPGAPLARRSPSLGQGFSSRPAYNASLTPDCWQQLAVVKDGSKLTFYYDSAPAGV